MKHKLLRIAQTAAFLAALLFALSSAASVLERKESANKLSPFFERPKEFDVLLIGNSHTVNGMLPLEMYEDYGITAFNMGGYGNSVPLSYWVLQNALDYAEPRVVVIDVHNAGETYMLSGSSGDEHKALDAFPLSMTKYRAINDLMSDPELINDEGDAYADLKWEFYFPIGKYHSRWRELGWGDFHPQPNREMGSETFSEVVAPDDYEIIDENMVSEEYGYGFEYLRKIIADCQARGIGVVLTHLPYPAEEDDQMDANTVWYIADEYGVDFLDFVAMDQVVDYRTDLCDPDHLNASGAKKISDFLGRFLVDHFDLEDRRADSRYAGWQSSLRTYNELKDARLSMQEAAESLLMLAHDNRYRTALYLRAGSPVHASELFNRLIHNIAREHIYEEDMYAKWSDSLFPLQALDNAQGEAYFAFISPGEETQIEQTGSSITGVQTGFGYLGCSQENGITTLQRDSGEEEMLFGRGGADLQLVIFNSETGAIVRTAEFSL